MSLSSEAVARLLEHVPNLVGWLCQKDPKDAANILATLGPRRRASRETRQAFSVLLQLPSLSETSTATIREILGEMPNEVWYRVLYVLITNPESPLVTNNCYEGLLELKDQIDSLPKDQLEVDDIDPDFMDDLWMILERLPYSSFLALGEICALVRDTSTNVANISRLLGPKILLPEGFESVEWQQGRASIERLGSVPSSPGMRSPMTRLRHMSKQSKASGSSFTSNNRKALVGEEDILKAGEIFHFLVRSADILFFKPKGSFGRAVPSVGYRARLFRPKDTLMVQREDRIKQLCAFYSLADEKLVVISKRLFDTFTLPQIAQGLWEQYSFLPEHWIGELELYHTEHEHDKGNEVYFKWFEENRNALQELNFKNLGEYKLCRRRYKEEEGNGINRVVEELFCGEEAYYNRLKSFHDLYAADLHDIAIGGRGDRQRKKLGLSEQDIRKVFGRRLTSLIESVEQIVIQFEVLRLVRGPVTVNNENGQRTRAGVLAEIILEYGSRLVDTYKNYTGTQARCQKILDSCRTRLQTDKKDPKAKNFLELWIQKSQQNKLLMGQSIDGILIAPCKRFTHYTLLFDRMRKELIKHSNPVNQNEISKIDAVIKLCNSVSGGMDGAIKTQTKADRLMGTDTTA